MRPLDLPREGEPAYKSFRDYTNEELIYYLEDNNMTADLFKMAGILSEILRRINEKTPIFPKEEETNCDNPLTP